MISSTPYAGDDGRILLGEIAHNKEPELDESQEPWGDREPDERRGCVTLLIPAFGMLIIFWLNS